MKYQTFFFSFHFRSRQKWAGAIQMSVARWDGWVCDLVVSIIDRYHAESIPFVIMNQIYIVFACVSLSHIRSTAQRGTARCFQMTKNNNWKVFYFETLWLRWYISSNPGFSLFSHRNVHGVFVRTLCQCQLLIYTTEKAPVATFYRRVYKNPERQFRSGSLAKIHVRFHCFICFGPMLMFVFNFSVAWTQYVYFCKLPNTEQHNKENVEGEMYMRKWLSVEWLIGWNAANVNMHSPFPSNRTIFIWPLKYSQFSRFLWSHLWNRKWSHRNTWYRIISISVYLYIYPYPIWLAETNIESNCSWLFFHAPMIHEAYLTVVYAVCLTLIRSHSSLSLTLHTLCPYIRPNKILVP